MQPTAQLPQTKQQPKVSRNASITGFILAILSLVSSAVGGFMIRAKYTPTGPTTGSVENEVGHAVATGTTTVLGALLGMPFLVGGITLALISAVFIILRITKIRVGGFIFSAVAVALLIWSVSIALGAFELIKADPAT